MEPSCGGDPLDHVVAHETRTASTSTAAAKPHARVGGSTVRRITVARGRSKT